MNIDWANFTPWASLGGGLLIGLSAAIFVLFNGRIAGISGIVSGLLKPKTGDIGWRLLFIGGMVSAALLYRLVIGMPEIQVDAGWGTLIIAGLLVGVGVRYGSGCTSGHGVCGISRLSPRSFMATGVFMAAGMVTVYVVRHLIGE